MSNHIPIRMFSPASPPNEEAQSVEMKGVPPDERTRIIRSAWPRLHSRPLAVPHGFARTGFGQHVFLVRETAAQELTLWHIMSCDHGLTELRWHGVCQTSHAAAAQMHQAFDIVWDMQQHKPTWFTADLVSGD